MHKAFFFGFAPDQRRCPCGARNMHPPFGISMDWIIIITIIVCILQVTFRIMYVFTVSNNYFIFNKFVIIFPFSTVEQLILDRAAVAIATPVS